MRHPTVTQAVPGTDWKKIRVLVFGLDDQFRFLARQTFRKLMVREVTPFAQPAELGKYLVQGFDILLLDLALKPEEGLKVLEDLRRPADNPHHALPVLAVAPSAMMEVLDRAKRLGIEGVAPKPISGHELGHRVGEILISPCRLPAPAAGRPKPNYVREAEPLPELGAEVKAPVVEPERSVAATVPEVAALMARLEARNGPVAARINEPRPDRSGPVQILTPAEAKPAPAPKPAAPAPKPAAPSPKPAAQPQAAAPAVPAPKPATPFTPSRGFASAGKGAPARRPSGSTLGEGDVAPARKLSAGPIEVAGLPDESEAKRRAARRRKEWEEAMEQAGHTARKGRDVAALDVSVVVADHAKWLESKGAEGRRATFTGMDLAGADLSGAVLANATFRQVDLSDARLAEARLDASDFRHAVLSAADLAGADLGVAALRHARLDLSNLEGAVLRGSDLSGAVLAGARTAGADFKGANLMGADLREADLSRAENLTQGQIDKALCDKSTRLPPGLFRRLDEDERVI